jgi:hypothetical protein
VINHLRNHFIPYPFLFGIYPVLSLIAHNAAEMDFVDGLRSLIAAILLTLLAYICMWILVRNQVKSALLTSLYLILFYSYGHINILSRSWTILNLPLGRHRTLLPLYGLIFVIGTLLILKTKRDLSGSTRFLNALAVILLFFPLFQLASYQVEEYQARKQQEQNLLGTGLLGVTGEQTYPDVYYIVVDGYPRGDFISRYLGSSNSEFLANLEARGFFVAHCSQSNYSDTRFSLASTLNMTYLDNGENIPEVVFSGSELDSMIRSGDVQQNFSDLGYTIVTFESGYKWLRWEASDLHLAPAQDQSPIQFEVGLNDFEQLFMDTTAVKALIDLQYVIDPEQMEALAEIINNPRATHRERVMYALDHLPALPDTVPGPKFVYAHIIFPHPPFVVNATGIPLQNSPPNELTAYADQITYLNQRLIEIIDLLIENSDREPIIIIQGDHGATVNYGVQGIDESYRLGILNAYYFPAEPDENGDSPGEISDLLYPSITPVNSFRLVFDRYFNGDYGLLADKSIMGRQSPFTSLDCTPPN